MKWIVALSFITTSLVACTPGGGSHQKQASKRIAFDSAIVYEQSKMADFANAAEVEGTPVSWEQLSSQAPALQELEARWQHKAISYVYNQVADLVSQKKLPGETATIDFFFAAPKEGLEKLFTQLSLSPRDEITVNFKGPQEPGLLAKVGDKTFSEQDLLSANLANAKLFKKMFTQRMRRLNGIVIRRYILKAAKAKDLPMEEYIKKNILAQSSDVTNEMVMEFAKKKGISEGDINEVMMDRLKDIIRQEERDRKLEDYVAKNLIKKPILVAFNAPQLSIQSPNLSEAVPHWGKDKGPSMLFVGHWACENCGSPLELFLDSKKKFGKAVKGWFLYSFPTQDREMRMSAEAGMCLYHQSPDYFWAFMDNFLKKAKVDNSEEAINEAAQSTGASFEDFRKCFLAREHKQAVDSHLDYVKNMGIYKTPVVVIEGRVFEAPLDNGEVTRALASFGGGMGDEGASFFSKIIQFFKGLFS